MVLFRLCFEAREQKQTRDIDQGELPSRWSILLGYINNDWRRLLGNVFRTEESQLDGCRGHRGDGYFDVIGYHCNGTSDVSQHRLEDAFLWTFGLGKESRT